METKFPGTGRRLGDEIPGLFPEQEREYQPKTVIVSNIPYSATEKDVKTVMSQFGIVVRCDLIQDRTMMRPHRGFAFVEFINNGSVEKAILSSEEVFLDDDHGFNGDNELRLKQAVIFGLLFRDQKIFIPLNGRRKLIIRPAYKKQFYMDQNNTGTSFQARQPNYPNFNNCRPPQSSETRRKGRDFYEMLGIRKDANQNEIRDAFKRSSLLWHPDKNPQFIEFSTDKFQELKDIYNILQNPDLKSLYDQLGEEALGVDKPSKPQAENIIRIKRDCYLNEEAFVKYERINGRTKEESHGKLYVSPCTEDGEEIELTECEGNRPIGDERHGRVVVVAHIVEHQPEPNVGMKQIMSNNQKIIDVDDDDYIIYTEDYVPNDILKIDFTTSEILIRVYDKCEHLPRVEHYCSDGENQYVISTK